MSMDIFKAIYFREFIFATKNCENKSLTKKNNLVNSNFPIVYNLLDSPEHSFKLSSLRRSNSFLS